MLQNGGALPNVIFLNSLWDILTKQHTLLEEVNDSGVTLIDRLD